MNKLRKKLLFLPAVVMFSTIDATAATIWVKNDDSTSVHVLIEAGEGHATKKHPYIETTIKPGEEREIDVSPKQFVNIEVFSVTGTVKMPSLYNKCFPLLMSKNYKIIFVGGRVGGTICVAQQLTKE
jgi:hypothetical protein